MQWEEDLSVKDKFGESNKMFCDLEKACLSVDDKCESLPTAMVDIQKDTIERMANEFDKRLQANAATITERISASADNAGERLPALLAIQRQSSSDTILSNTMSVRCENIRRRITLFTRD